MMKKMDLFSIDEQLLRQDELTIISKYLELLEMKYPAATICASAAELITAIRRLDDTPNPVELLMTEYSMGHEEGLLLMSLSEALLRTKHAGTKDDLVADKLVQGLWSKRSHLFQTWTAYFLEKSLSCSRWLLSHTGLWVGKMSAKSIRVSMQVIMRALADQFVFSETIQKAIARAETELNKGYRY